jgi:hypothetical protein
MTSLCSRLDLIATRPKALVCAYFLNGSSAYNYWVSRMPPHNRIRAMPIGHREDSTGETMTQKSAATFSRCSNVSGCVAYPALGEPAKLSRGNPGPTCFACQERRVATELAASAADSRDIRRRKVKGLRVCAEQPSCARPATQRYGETLVCCEHDAAEKRAQFAYPS